MLCTMTRFKRHAICLIPGYIDAILLIVSQW